jgi:hypothetical protein
MERATNVDDRTFRFSERDRSTMASTSPIENPRRSPIPLNLGIGDQSSSAAVRGLEALMDVLT